MQGSTLDRPIGSTSEMGSRITNLPAATWRICSLFAGLVPVLYALVPDIVRNRSHIESNSTANQPPTIYLNGLRGLTAVKVFTFHYLMAFTDSTHRPYGVDEKHQHWLEYPIIRFPWAGFTSNVFFCVAGYLTAVRLFPLMDKDDALSQAKILSVCAGSLFRRGFRLYLPVFAITLMTATYIYLGFYETNRPLIVDHVDLFPGVWNEQKPERAPTYIGQLQFWSAEMANLTNFLSAETYYPHHDQHLWSILAEMRASLQLHGCLIAVATCTRQARLVCLVILTGLYIYWDHWEVWVYLLGAVIAHVDLDLAEKAQKIALDQEEPKVELTQMDGDSKTGHFLPTSAEHSTATPDATTSAVNTALRYGGFLTAFYFLSYPIEGAVEHAPGYLTLNRFIPWWTSRPDKFYPNFGVALFLFLLVRSDPQTSRWRQLCVHWLPQYLGKISFAFYLVHGPVMHICGYMVPHYLWWAFGVEGKDVEGLCWLGPIAVGWAVSLFLSIWFADCWRREVETRFVRLCKWMEKLCFRKQS